MKYRKAKKRLKRLIIEGKLPDGCYLFQGMYGKTITDESDLSNLQKQA